ncbi:phosphoribosylaminoimidazolesuccinocarboxamide synthase [candidate division KSB1 bacterium]|nr:phosphoribosylaminoimidazolesuccinocarboxamide synthase [candidate division KSB1 bacterium]
MTLKKKKKILEGSTKKLYSTDEPEHIIQEFMDTVLKDGESKSTIKGKGAINNQICGHLFEYLEGFHIPTHFVKSIGNKEMLVKKLDMIPVEIFVHNIATGEFCKRFGQKDGQELELPIVEMFLKKPELNNPMINNGHVVAFGMATTEDINQIERFSSKVNAVLKSFFTRRGLKLVDFKLEFGRHKEKIVLGDEISPDTFQLWDSKTKERLGLDKITSGESTPESAYEDIFNRIFKS